MTFQVINKIEIGNKNKPQNHKIPNIEKINTTNSIVFSFPDLNESKGNLKK